MPTPIEIEVGDVTLRGELSDTESARAIADALPLELDFDTWGDEFYFRIPVDLDLDETATSRVDVGTIGYWPRGSALAIFFGPTPMSCDERPVPASDVNLVGTLQNARQLADVAGESRIFVRRVE